MEQLHMSKPAIRQYSLIEFHSELLRECFDSNLTLERAMVVFTILSSCILRLKYPTTCSPGLNLAPLTTRGCAEALAAIWRDTPGSDFTPEYFYYQWWGQWGGTGRSERFSPADAFMANEVMQTLEAHPAIAAVVPEYEDLNPFEPHLNA
jgi:hypothetical protein